MRRNDKTIDELKAQLIEKRNQKFSRAASDAIINNPLRDKALLSRSTNNHIQSLLSSSQLRNEFLHNLRNQNIGQREHGLRKMREIAVSMFNQKKGDKQFLEWTYEVYKLSYDFYFDKREFNKLHSLVLNFMATELPREMTKGYVEVCIISESHVACDMDKCLKLIGKFNQGEELSGLSHSLLQLSLIYLNQISPPSDWFRIVASLSANSILYTYLKSLPAFTEMERKTLETIRKCYNQVSLEFLSKRWFSDIVDLTQLEKSHRVVTRPNGYRVLIFKGK